MRGACSASRIAESFTRVARPGRPLGTSCLAAAALLLALASPACGEDQAATCGAGTVEQGGQCVAASSDDDRGRRSPGDESDAGSATEDTGDTSADTEADTSTLTDATADAPAEQPDVVVVDTPSTDDAPADRDNSSCIAENVGLEAVGFWDGTWDGHVEGSHPLVGGDFYQLADGTVSFEIYCEDSKLVIQGRMDGLANGAFPFGGDLVGEYDPESHLIHMDLQNASVNMMILNVEFVATLDGELVGDTFENGTWSGESTNPTGATGDGTWTATKRP